MSAPQNKVLKLSKEFSETPGPRYKWEGNFSGEEFREELLFHSMNHAIENDYKLVIDLDGTAGYGTSFLEESFGGLIRIEGLKYKDIVSHLKIISNEEDYLIQDIEKYLSEAGEEERNGTNNAS